MEGGITLGRPTVEIGGHTYTPTDWDIELAEKIDDPADDFTGWYCLKTDPFPCPAEGCMFVAHYATAAHRVVVFPEMDDPQLLNLARNTQRVGRNPRVVEYERSMGPCIAWDRWVNMGRPVHAVGSDERKDWK